TNFSLNDSVSIGSGYSISWSSNSTTLPTDQVTFANKFLNITNRSGTVSIDSIVWSWASSELTGYNESRFVLYKYNGSWSLLNNSPDTAANEISLSSVSSFSIFGILQNNDSTAPTVTLISPVNNTNTSNATLFFTFNATDNLDSTLNCSLFVDNVYNQSNPSTTHGTTTTFSSVPIPEGSHNWSVNCADSLENQGNSSVRNFIVDQTSPIVSLISPVNNTNTTNTTIYLNFNETDNLFSNTNCSLFVNNIYNQSNSSTLNATTTTFTLSSLSDGNYNWTVQCADSAGNVANSSARNFTLDTTGPTVTLISPANTTSTTNTSLNFTFNATDAVSTFMNCSLYINNILNATNSSVSNATNTTFNLTGLSVGSYNWTVGCTDNLNNGANSSTSLFTIASSTLPSNGDGKNNRPVPSLSVDLSSSCTQNSITVSSSGSISGASVEVVDSSGSPVASGTTDSSGHFTFSGCGFGVNVYATKSGYLPGDVSSTLVSCSCLLPP
ncbi:hypothetical protein HZC07_05305, partial [Candidatus Micrarchaeota archaeon]|nr:hypothetical protein [Candidatus Micrarchaeota archaeon]